MTMKLRAMVERRTCKEYPRIQICAFAICASRETAVMHVSRTESSIYIHQDFQISWSLFFGSDSREPVSPQYSFSLWILKMNSDTGTTIANSSFLETESCDLLRRQFVTLYPVEMWKSEGFFADEDLFNINCHWLKFAPVKPLAHFVLGIIYIVIFAIGCSSNLLVICVLIR